MTKLEQLKESKKLRNKKTGKVGDLLGSCNSVPFIAIAVDYHDGNPIMYEYDSIAKFNEEWEDYETKKPKLENERIRKIVRAWADKNGSTEVVYYSPKNALVDSQGNSIGFNLILRGLHHGVEYAVDELCGEEEK